MSRFGSLRFRLRLILTACAFLCLVPTAPRAQDRGIAVLAREITGKPDFDIGRQYAVIIGIDKYAEWHSLRAAVKEAKAIRRILDERYVIDEFLELYDEEATASNIRRLFIETLPRKLGPKDSLLVFYAGHGQTDATNTGFWIASDGSKDVFSQNNWIPNQQLRNMIGGLKAQRILILADACFAGDFINVSRGVAPTIDSAYYRKALQLTARQVLTSGASESVPDESEFGRQLLNLLERNEEALLDPISMYERVRLGVTKTVPLLGTLPGNESGASFVLFRKGASSVVLGGGTTASAAPPRASGSADLMVRTDQIGAEIFVDGVSRGQSPVLVKKLDAGRALKVQARTATMSGSLELSLNPGELKEVTVSLRALTGNLYLSANESAVHLWIDGVDKGPLGSGLFTSIPVGARKIELKGQDLYGEAQATIAADETAEVKATVRPVGKVSIEAPADAVIALSGADWRREQRGGGTVINVPAGDLRLTAEGQGYLPASSNQSLRRGQSISWKPWTGGAIEFAVSPAGAACLVDGAPAVEARGRVENLAPGPHSLVFKKAGYRDLSLSANVSLGRSSRVEASLQKLTAATLRHQDFGVELALDIRGAESRSLGHQDFGVELTLDIRGAEVRSLGGSGGKAAWSVEAGIPVSVRYRSPYAERIDATTLSNVSLGEGETRDLAIPTGRFSLPWLPEGVLVEIGSSRTLALANEAKGGFLSPLLPVGVYRVSLAGTELSSLVTIGAGTTSEPEGYRQNLLAQLSAERAAHEKSLSAKMGRTRIGWISLVTGALGAVGTGAVYFLGGEAMKAYDAAPTTAGAAEAWKTVELYGTLLPVAAAIGGLGLGLTPILWLGGPDPKALQRSIDALDEGIRALGK